MAKWDAPLWPEAKDMATFLGLLTTGTICDDGLGDTWLGYLQGAGQSRGDPFMEASMGGLPIG